MNELVVLHKVALGNEKFCMRVHRRFIAYIDIGESLYSLAAKYVWYIIVDPEW